MRWLRGSIRRAFRVGIAGALVACGPDASGPAGDGLDAPRDLDDGWTVATPASVGIDEAAISALVDRIRQGEFGEIHALLVVRHGRLALERYFSGYDGTGPHTLQSVTKSVTSALIGVALGRGEIESLDLTLGALFPDYADILGADPVKASIRIGDLLAMRAGMAWDESTYPFSDDRNDVGRLNRSTDWIRSALEQPMEATPGTTWRYSSGAAILLSGILLRKTGVDAVEYAERFLFGPLGIHDFDWYRNPRDGLPHTGGGLYLLPRDLARFGQLYLDGGLWKSVRVVPESWVRESASVRSNVGDDGYGYLWWTRPLRGVPGHLPQRPDVLFGWGYGGQHVFVSPDLDLVVVVNAWNADGSSRGPALFDSLVEAIEP